MKFALPVLCIAAVLISDARADEPPPPRITSSTVQGVWEAAPAGGDIVYQLAVIAGGEGYLVFLLGGTREQIYRLVSSKVAGGKVSLRSRTHGSENIAITTTTAF